MADTTSRKPSHIAYHVRQGSGDDDNAYWSKIGAAWDHGDGKGLDVALELVPPADGGRVRITLRAAEEKPEGCG